MYSENKIDHHMMVYREGDNLCQFNYGWKAVQDTGECLIN